MQNNVLMIIGPWSRTSTLNSIAKAKTLKTIKFKLTFLAVMILWQSLTPKNNKVRSTLLPKSDSLKTKILASRSKESEAVVPTSRQWKLWRKKILIIFSKYRWHHKSRFSKSYLSKMDKESWSLSPTILALKEWNMMQALHMTFFKIENSRWALSKVC